MNRDLAHAARRRAIALGAVAALALPACASGRGETVATVPAGMGMAPPSMAAAEPASRVASAPLGYPWAAGASLPTAAARAPGRTIR